MVLLGNARTSVSRDRNQTRRKLGGLLWAVAALDAATVTAAVLLAWSLRLNFDVWTADIDPDQALSATVGPWIIVAWMTLLAAQGAYSLRSFGTGNEEFKTVYLASVITAGVVGMVSYLLNLQLSRGFVLLTFFIGIPLLLVERYVARKVLHRLRVRGKLLHRVVAVGGPTAVRELVEVLRRERYAGYEIVGACVPVGIPADEDEMTVPHLGAVADAHRVCDEVGADTVLVARGGYASSSDLRQIAWDLEGTDIDLVVVPSLTDVAGPRIHMRPVAGLPLLHVEDPQVDEAGGFSKRVFDVVGSLFGILLISPILVVVAAAGEARGRRTDLLPPDPGSAGTAREFGMLQVPVDAPDAAERATRSSTVADESEGVLFKIEKDPRITRIGRFIRTILHR